MTLVLNTKRLAIKPIARDDRDALHQFWTDVDVRRYLWDGKVISSSQVEDIIATSESLFAEVGLGLFSLCLVEETSGENSLVGFCGYQMGEISGTYPVSPQGDSIAQSKPEVPSKAELLYGILPQYWGLGLVSEATREVLRYGFVEKNLEEVVAATDTPNQRSVTVMQRLGMTFEERREYHGLDTVFYSLNRHQFLS